MFSASDQKLFCGVCSAFKCSFDEFVREKVVSPSYSSTIFELIFLDCNKMGTHSICSLHSVVARLKGHHIHIVLSPGPVTL